MNMEGAWLDSKHPYKYLSITIGKTLRCHEDIKKWFCKRMPGLQEVQEDNDAILGFCHIAQYGSHLKESIINSLVSLSESKPVVLVVLHQTSDPENKVPHLRETLIGDKILKVDCLLQENEELLDCNQNESSLCQVVEWLTSKVKKEKSSQSPPPMAPKTVNIFSCCATGNTLSSHKECVQILCRQRAGLREVLTVEESDIILCFCSIVSEAETDIEAALKNLNVLAPESIIPYINRENTLTRDCVIQVGILNCSKKNDEDFRMVLNSIDTKIEEKKPEIEKSKPIVLVVLHQTRDSESKPGRSMVKKDSVSQKKDVVQARGMKVVNVNLFIRVSGNTLGSHKDFVRILCNHRAGLQEVSTVEESDVVLCFCPIVSRAGTDIEAALQNLNDIPDKNDVALVVLHHTFNPESIVLDSNRAVSRKNTLAVDCLFYEDRGLLHCNKNDDAITTVLRLIDTKAPKQACTKTNGESSAEKLQNQNVEVTPKTPGRSGYSSWKWPEFRLTGSEKKGKSEGFAQNSKEHLSRNIRYIQISRGNTVNAHIRCIKMLRKQLPGLQEVSSVGQYDIILAFCTVDASVNIENELQRTHATKPAVLVVLHDMNYPVRAIPNISPSSIREETIIVDCLFRKDAGLLVCSENSEVFQSVSEWLNDKLCSKRVPCEAPPQRNNSLSRSSFSQRKGACTGRPQKVKFFIVITGITLDSHKEFARTLRDRRTDLQEVFSAQECDFILCFCPVVSHAGVDIEAALQKLNNIQGSHPVVLVVLHHTFNPESIVPESSRSVNRNDTLAVDCLFHEDRGILRCPKNDDVYSSVLAWIETQAKSKTARGADNSLCTMTEQSSQESSHAKSQEEENKLKKLKMDSSSPGQSIKYYSIINEDTDGSHLDLLRELHKEAPGLREVSSVNECEVLMEFFIVDTSAHFEMQRQRTDATKPAVLVMLHDITSDPDRTIPDIISSTREDTLTVHCAFFKGIGLVQHPKNTEAFRIISDWLKSKGKKEKDVEMTWKQPGAYY